MVSSWVQGAFGYTRVKVSDGVKERPTLEVDPVAAPIAREIFESSAGATGWRKSARSLTAGASPTGEDAGRRTWSTTS